MWTRVPGGARPNALENYRTLGDRIIEVPKGMLALSLVFEIRRICLGREVRLLDFARFIAPEAAARAPHFYPPVVPGKGLAWS